jgi:hypothetical protein
MGHAGAGRGFITLSKKMPDSYDPAAWALKWPHKETPHWEAWREVYARFGIAAQRGCDLETGLVMLISQMEQILKQKLQLEGLLAALEKNGMLPLGPLITLFCKLYPVPEGDDLVAELGKAKKSRNYLIHHFYRDRAALFTTPEGCEKAIEILVSIHDDMDVAVQYLEDWRDEHLGYRPPEEIWESINQDITKWQNEQRLMLDAFLGKNERKG